MFSFTSDPPTSTARPRQDMTSRPRLTRRAPGIGNKRSHSLGTHPTSTGAAGGDIHSRRGGPRFETVAVTTTAIATVCELDSVSSDSGSTRPTGGPPQWRCIVAPSSRGSSAAPNGISDQDLTPQPQQPNDPTRHDTQAESSNLGDCLARMSPNSIALRIQRTQEFVNTQTSQVVREFFHRLQVH